MPVFQRVPLYEDSLLRSKEEILQALVRGWMGLAQLNAKTWPRTKDLSTLASHLVSEKASIDWTRIHRWIQDNAPVPDEQPPNGVEASHWRIDRALYRLIKNRHANLASVESLRDSGRPGSSDEDLQSEDEDADGSPAPPSPLPSHDGRHRTPSGNITTSTEDALEEDLGSPRAPSSASRTCTAGRDDGTLPGVEVTSKAPAPPTVSALKVQSVQSLPRAVDDAEQADRTFCEMLVDIFQEYGFHPKDQNHWDGVIPMDEDFYPTVTLVGNGTIKIHGWDHRPCYGFPNGKAIYCPLTDMPLHYQASTHKLMVTTKDVAKGLARHTTCMEGDIYFYLVHRTPIMLQMTPFAAIDCNQVLRVNDNYWADLTIGDIEGDIPMLEDIKLLLEICILLVFKSIPPAPTKRNSAIDESAAHGDVFGMTEEPNPVALAAEQEREHSAQPTYVTVPAMKVRSRKAPIKHRELYLEWLHKTKWEGNPKTHIICKMGKYARQQLSALLGLVNFIAELIKDTAFTDNQADPHIQFKLVPMGIFADFLSHGEEWVNNCLLIKRKLPLCTGLPAMGKAIRRAAKHGLRISTVVDAINAALSTNRKRKRSEVEGSGSDDEDDEDDEDEEDETFDDILGKVEPENWLLDADENSESWTPDGDVDYPEWEGISV